MASSRALHTQMQLHLILPLPRLPVQPSPHPSILHHGLLVRETGPVPTREHELLSVNLRSWRRSTLQPELGQSFPLPSLPLGLIAISWQSERCVGETGSIPRLRFRGLCLQDSPLGLRFSERLSSSTAPRVNVDHTCSRLQFCLSCRRQCCSYL